MVYRGVRGGVEDRWYKKLRQPDGTITEVPSKAHGVKSRWNPLRRYRKYRALQGFRGRAGSRGVTARAAVRSHHGDSHRPEVGQGDRLRRLPLVVSRAGTYRQEDRRDPQDHVGHPRTAALGEGARRRGAALSRQRLGGEDGQRRSRRPHHREQFPPPPHGSRRCGRGWTTPP